MTRLLTTCSHLEKLSVHICQDPVCRLFLHLQLHPTPHCLRQTVRVPGGSPLDPLDQCFSMGSGSPGPVLRNTALDNRLPPQKGAV